MSEIFEALRKAQREADSQRAGTPGGSEPATGRIVGGSPENAGPVVSVRAKPPSPRAGRAGWLARLRGKTQRNGREAYSPVLLMFPDRETPIGEQFRILRTRLEMAGPGTVMITSAVDQEGKTLCATNLAVALSMQVGAAVVLADADLRHPSVGACFGLHGGPGLVDCLLGDARWQDCIVPTRYERLSVLPAGRSSAMAPELLGSERMDTVDRKSTRLNSSH